MALNEFTLNASGLNDASALAWPVTTSTALLNGTMLDVLPLHGTGTGSRSVVLTAIITATSSVIKEAGHIFGVVTYTATATLRRAIGAVRAITVTATPISAPREMAAGRVVTVTATPTFIRVIGYLKTVTVSLTPALQFPGVRSLVLIASNVTATAVVIKSALSNQISNGATALAARVVLTVGAVRTFNIFPTATVPRSVLATRGVTVTTVVNSATDAIRRLVYKLAKFVTYVRGESTNERTTYLVGDSRTTYTDDQ
jgi:hypothetical protein